MVEVQGLLNLNGRWLPNTVGHEMVTVNQSNYMGVIVKNCFMLCCSGHMDLFTTMHRQPSVT